MPGCTLLVMAGALAAYLCPELAAWCVYDRAAVLQGQLWRLVSAHLVHFDQAHLLYDLLAFGLVGWLLETQGALRFRLLCLGMTLCIGVFLLIARPEMARYGGLSGLAYGAFVYLALSGLRQPNSQGWLHQLLLLILLLKLFYEIHAGASLFFSPASLAFISVWEAHAVGGATALLSFALQRGLDQWQGHVLLNVKAILSKDLTLQ